MGRELAELTGERFVGCGGALDVVLHTPELELAVVATNRVRSTHVPVERHSDAAGVDQRRSVRARPLELQVRVTEDDRLLANTVEHPLVVVARLGGKAVYVRQRRAVHVENAVQLVLRLQ